MRKKKKRNLGSEVQFKGWQREKEQRRKKYTDHDPNATMQNKYNNLPKLF